MSLAAYIQSTKQSLFASLLLGIWCKVESFPPALGETMLVDPTVCGLIKTKYALAPMLQYVPEYTDKIRICVWLPRARSRHVQHMHSLSPGVVHSSQSWLLLPFDAPNTAPIPLYTFSSLDLLRALRRFMCLHRMQNHSFLDRTQRHNRAGKSVCADF